MKKKIAILGSTGSIGKNLIDIVKKDKNNFEIVLLTAGSGVGKSQVCREIAADLVSKKKNIGYIALEESVARSVRGLMSIDLNQMNYPCLFVELWQESLLDLV